MSIGLWLLWLTYIENPFFCFQIREAVLISRMMDAVLGFFIAKLDQYVYKRMIDLAIWPC